MYDSGRNWKQQQILLLASWLLVSLAAGLLAAFFGVFFVAGFFATGFFAACFFASVFLAFGCWFDDPRQVHSFICSLLQGAMKSVL